MVKIKTVLLPTRNPQLESQPKINKLWIYITIILIFALLWPAETHAQVAIVATVKAQELNVRSGPSVEAAIIGTLKRGSKVEVSGVDKGGNWLFFRFWGKEAWVKYSASFMALSGPISSLPIVTLKSEVTAGPQIALAGYTINPAVPEPDQPFTIHLQVTNSGAAAGPFAIAGYGPGGFIYIQVRNLDARETREIVLQTTADHATGRFEIPIILDIDNQLSAEVSQAQRAVVALQVDRPFTAQAKVAIQKFTTIDLHGGTPDFEFSNEGLRAVNGAQLRLLNVSRAAVHYDLLDRIGGKMISAKDLKPGALIGFLLTEGRRGFFEVVSVGDVQLEIAYFVYAL